MSPQPCPFCGGKARVQAYHKLYGYSWARVMCTEDDCKARGPTVTGAAQKPRSCWDQLPRQADLPTLADLKLWATERWNNKCPQP